MPKNNRQFRQLATQKVSYMTWLMGHDAFLWFKSPTIKGTYFSTKQTRIINKLKELRK